MSQQQPWLAAHARASCASLTPRPRPPSCCSASDPDLKCKGGAHKDFVGCTNCTRSKKLYTGVRYITVNDGGSDVSGAVHASCCYRRRAGRATRVCSLA